MLIAPGSTLGILGGGQLGRMTAMAAHSLGYHVHALDPDPQCAARPVVDQCFTAAFDDIEMASNFARKCNVVTLEIERVALASLDAAAVFAPVRPSRALLAVIQDRAVQRQWLARHGFPQGPWRHCDDVDALREALNVLGGRCFVKSCRDGYDGRGQYCTRQTTDADEAWQSVGSAPCVAEQALDLAAEVSVLVARSPSGAVAVHPPAMNHHENRILAWSVIPAPLESQVLVRAREIATDLATTLSLEGILAVELFVTRGGDIFVNELAPRPHNSVGVCNQSV
jgi:5-(carboxyamino)imidazole ribonucleotide synthase